MYHLSVCLDTALGRDALVMTAETETAAVRMAESCDGLIGFHGNDSFREAVRRCQLMRDNGPNAWGIIK